MRLAISLLIALSTTVNAATCYVDDSEGGRWYKNIPSKTGVLPKTLGYVSASKPCVNSVGLRVAESPAQALCMRNALAVCDSRWGGSKLSPNPNLPDSGNQCLFWTVKSGQESESGKLYYNLLQVYDAKGVDGICPR